MLGPALHSVLTCARHPAASQPAGQPASAPALYPTSDGPRMPWCRRVLKAPVLPSMPLTFAAMPPPRRAARACTSPPAAARRRLPLRPGLGPRRMSQGRGVVIARCASFPSHRQASHPGNTASLNISVVSSSVDVGGGGAAADGAAPAALITCSLAGLLLSGFKLAAPFHPACATLSERGSHAPHICGRA